MSLQMLSRRLPFLRTGRASPAACIRAWRSSKSNASNGDCTHSLDLTSSFSCLVLREEVLRTPFKWLAAASRKLQEGEATGSSKPKPKHISSNVVESRTVNLTTLSSSSDSRAYDGPSLLQSKSSTELNPFHQRRLQFNWGSSAFCKALHSAAGNDDDEDESVDSDDFFSEPETYKNKGRGASAAMTKKSQTPPQVISDSEGDDEGPVIVNKKRKASAIEACEDSDDEEDDSFFTRQKSSSTISAKSRRFDDRRNVSDTRVPSFKKRPAPHGNMHEDKLKRVGRDRSETCGIPNSDGSDEESEESEVGVDEETKHHDAEAEEETSGPSHLTKTRFDKFPISPLSIKALHTVLRYERMTEVQEATFPVILKGQDVLAKARTGTGKTIAFLLPAIEAILKAPEGRARNPINVLIVCPTRELAQQAAAEAKVLLQFHRGLGAQVVFGGCSIRGEQMNLSKSPCQILVGTPGRLVDHIQRTPDMGRQLKSVQLFVLDEADHMLDMGFRDSLQKIMQALPSKRQTLLFSATIPREVHSMAKIALRDDHVYIDAVGKNSQDTHIKVKQQYIMAPLEKQIRVLYAALQQHIEAEPNYKVLVFCSTARGTGFMCKLFLNLGFNAREIHSRKDQNYRTRVSDEFRNSKGGMILFTSDVSARGVDYPNVTLVVQVGAPSEFEQYIHRLGRTGRAGKKGEGLIILAPWEDYFLQKLSKLPIVPLPPPKLTSHAKQKILLAANSVDLSLKEMAYTSWLGYYKSLKGLTLDKAMLVEYANQYSSSMGFDEPPALSKMLVSKMSLSGVPGIRLKR